MRRRGGWTQHPGGEHPGGPQANIGRGTAERARLALSGSTRGVSSYGSPLAYQSVSVVSLTIDACPPSL